MKELTLEITSKCYQNCPWCSSNSKENGEHLKTKKIKRLLREHRKTCDVVRFSGGEPTLHPDLYSLILYAKGLDYKTILLTNGYSIPQDIWDSPYVDEYWIDVVGKESLLKTLYLHALGKTVVMEIVMVEGNEEWIRETMKFSLTHNIPVRLLTLQKQGRGVNCKPLNLITWTGDKGCNKDNKITITHDGKIVSCSALKYGKCSLDREV